DEGDPEEVQARPAEAERGTDEVLPGEQGQPGRLVPADAAAAAGLHRPLLHASPLQVCKGGRSRVPPLHAVDRGAYDDALGRLCAPFRLRHQPDGVVVLHDDHHRQDSAHALHADAGRLRLHHRPFPRRPCPVLGDDEPLDRRAGADHATPGREDAGACHRETQLANTAEGRRLERQRGQTRTPAADAGSVRLAAAPPGASQEETYEPEVNEVTDVTAEATGETVGEAKWAALRELERRHPGLDKAAVQFEVVAEGERGILGVGYEPARVVAHLPAEAAEAAAAVETASEASDQATEARTLVAQIVETLGVDADVVARDEAEAIVVTCS